MESTAQNNSAMMATGASLADLPQDPLAVEESSASKEDQGESSKDDEVSEVVDKILEDIKSSGNHQASIVGKCDKM